MQVTKGTWHMREQCVPGSLSSSSAQEPGNEAMPSLFQSVVTRVKSALETSQQIPAKSLKKQLFSSLKVSCKVEFTSPLEGLEVQSKLLDSTDLESSSKIWKRIIQARMQSCLQENLPCSQACWHPFKTCAVVGRGLPHRGHFGSTCQRARFRGVGSVSVGE